MRLPPLPTISELLRLYKISAQKRLSQNFLLDMNVNKKLVKKAGSIDGGHVCEVGPGPGGITRAILEQNVKHLHVIEKDKRFFPALELLSETSGCLTVHHGDVLNFDMGSLFPEELIQPWDKDPPNIHIMGNLPFNISTPLIIRYLEAISNHTDAWKFGRTKMTLTFQKEVAQRMVAPICTDHRCRLSVMCQYLCEVQLKYIIPGKAFVPPPKVDVGVVHFKPHKKPKIDLPFKLVEKVCRHIFHYRNKMIKHGIRTLFPDDQPELAVEMIERAGVEADCRSFMLSLEEFNRLCHIYNQICTRLPYMFHYDYRNRKIVRAYKQNLLQDAYIRDLQTPTSTVDMT